MIHFQMFSGLSLCVPSSLTAACKSALCGDSALSNGKTTTAFPARFGGMQALNGHFTSWRLGPQIIPQKAYRYMCVLLCMNIYKVVFFN